MSSWAQQQPLPVLRNDGSRGSPAPIDAGVELYVRARQAPDAVSSAAASTADGALSRAPTATDVLPPFPRVSRSVYVGQTARPLFASVAPVCTLATMTGEPTPSTAYGSVSLVAMADGQY